MRRAASRAFHPAQASTAARASATSVFPHPPIAGTLSFWLTEIGDGVAVFEGEPGPHLLNPLGIVHGGWAMTLIDSAAGCAAHTLLPAGASYATIETKANFSADRRRRWSGAR